MTYNPNASQAISQIFTAVDNLTGLPLAGGQLYTYASGTNTYQAAYTDNTLTVPLSQPIILDNYGQAIIWLSANSYRFNLLNAAGVQQAHYPQDNIQPSSFTTFTTQLAAYSTALQGQGLVGYNSSLSYPVNTLPNALASSAVGQGTSLVGNTLINQGADPTGVISSNTALSSAISASLPALHITRGTYLISSNITIPSTMALTFDLGAIFKISTGVTVTINGPLTDCLYQIFSCQGTGNVVFGYGAIEEIRPEWWYSGSGDWSSAINYAIIASSVTYAWDQNDGFHTTSAIGSKVKLSQQNYTIKYPIKLVDKTTFEGSGYRTVIQPAAGFQGSALIVNYNDFVGSIAGQTLTVTQMNAGTLAVGQLLSSGTYSQLSAGVNSSGLVPAVPYNIIISALGSGSGGTGTYTIFNNTGGTWTASTVVSLNQVVNNGANAYICVAITGDAKTASSGGPTGTGTGIVDNHVTWNYFVVASQNLQTLDQTTWGFYQGTQKISDLQLYDTIGFNLLMGVSLLSSTWDSQISQVSVNNFYRSGVKLDACYGITFTGLYIYSCCKAQAGAGNLWLTSTNPIDESTTLNFMGCKFQGSPIGIFGVTIEHASTISFRGCIWESNAYGTSILASGDVTFDTCYFEDLDREIYTLQYNGASSNSGIRVNNCAFTKGSYTTAAILLSGCVGTIFDNISYAATSSLLLSTNSNASQWKMLNSNQTGGNISGMGRREVLFDDFMGNALSSIWTTTAVNSGTAASLVPAAGGVYRLQSGITTGSSETLSLGTGTYLEIAQNYIIEARIRLNAAIGNITNANFRFGLFGNAGGSTAGQYIYFQGGTGSAILTNYNGTGNTVSGSIPTQDTNWHQYVLYVTPNNSSLFIDNTLCATNSLYLPTGYLSPQILVYNGSTNNCTLDVDYIKIETDRIALP